MPASFREAAPADLETVVAFMRALYAHDRLPFDEERARRTITEVMGDRALGGAWIALEDGEPVGYAVITFGYSLQYGGRDAFVDELFVREELRGRGLGRALLAHVESRCRELGVAALHLAVEDRNRVAQGLYRTFGFADQGFRLMSKPLADPHARRRSGH